MATIAKLTRLKILTISPTFPRVQPAFTLSANGIEQLGQFPRIESLYLADPLTVDDAWLRSLGKLTSLIDLGVMGAKITDSGLAPLGALTRLDRLEIGSPQITDAGLKALFPLTRLTTISLYADVGDAGIASLRTALPSLGQINSGRWQDHPILRPAEAAPSP